jgi:predicted tellurium resistance membrane protein TerC
MAKLNPFHVLVVGIAMALVFVVGLIALVNWVVAQPITL